MEKWPFANLFPRPQDRIPFTKHNFYTEFAPVLAFFYILAVLVQLPNTRKIRLAILPVMGTMAWRVSTRYDYDPSPEPGYNWYSFAICVSVFLLRLCIEIDFHCYLTSGS